jgi:hypothetical protein
MRSKKDESGKMSDPGVCGALSAGLGVARFSKGGRRVGDDDRISRGRFREFASTVKVFMFERRRCDGVIDRRLCAADKMC